MNTTSKWIVGIIIVIIVVWGGYSLFNKEPDSTGPIKIGFIGPLTGDAASYGEAVRNVAELAVKEINSNGGINGKPIKMIYEDGKCSGKDSTNAMQKLVNVDNVKIVIGGFCSSESLAAVPVAEQNKVFLISGGSSSPDLTGISKYFVRDYPSDASQGIVLADVAFNKNNWKKVALIQEQLDYPLGIYKAFLSSFEKLGGTVVKEEFPTQATDFRSQLTKLRGGNPDALFVDTQTSASAQRVLKQVNDLGWNIPILFSDSVSTDRDYIKNNADILEGALSAEFGVDVNNPKFKGMVEAYKEEFGVEAPYQNYLQTVYDAVYLVGDAIDDVGYNADKISDWFYRVKDWDGASGKITISKDGDRIGGHIPKIVRNGLVEDYIE